jgi:tetratricopeptide (TPR) repeat protein
MRRFERIRFLLRDAIPALCSLLLMLPLSCAHEKKAEVNRDAIVKKRADPGLAQKRMQQQIEEGIQRAQRQLEAKEFQKALGVYRSLHAKYPQEESLVNAYARTIEDIKGAADKAFDSEDHVRAGTMYALLLKNYPSFKSFHKTLSFNKAHLVARIDECGACLYRKGIEQYRQNDLSGAIGIWESVLSFDPRNPETQRAIAMAKLQLRTLRDMK